MHKTILAALVTFGAPTLALAGDPTFDPKGRPTPPQEGAAAPEPMRAPTPLSMEDQTFMRKAAEMGMAEMKMAKLVVEKGKNNETKRLAQTMIDDHQKANDDLKRIAEKKGMTLPTEPDPVQKATIERLSKLSGEELDRAFMEENTRMHEDAVRMFRNEASMSKDPELKAFAARTLPTLNQHMDMAKRRPEQPQQPM